MNKTGFVLLVGLGVWFVVNSVSQIEVIGPEWWLRLFGIFFLQWVSAIVFDKLTLREGK